MYSLADTTRKPTGVPRFHTVLRSAVLASNLTSYNNLLLIKFSRASSRVNWLKVDKTDVSRTISVLVLRETEVTVKASNQIIYLLLNHDETFSRSRVRIVPRTWSTYTTHHTLRIRFYHATSRIIAFPPPFTLSLLLSKVGCWKW
jgi:hypothetical protein